MAKKEKPLADAKPTPACAHCGKLSRTGNSTVPYGAMDHVWLHTTCWAEWYQARRSGNDQDE